MNAHEQYHFFKEASLCHRTNAVVEQKYDGGFVFTRLGPHLMRQVRSVRVPCSTFQLSSENRRILKKYSPLVIHYNPLPYQGYHWKQAKMAVDFYREKTGTRAMSGQKIKSLFTSPHSSMNGVFAYQWEQEEFPIGYCLLFHATHMLHYAYPFYDLRHARALALSSLGMAMMLKAILWAQEKHLDYVYLGSIQNERSLYKFQFNGVEWFDGEKWQQGKPEKFQIQSSKFK